MYALANKNRPCSCSHLKTFISCYSILSDYLKITIDSHFSPGDFKDVWQKKQPTDHQKPDEQQCDLQEEATTLEQSDLQEEATLEIPSQAINVILILKSTLSLENVNYN